jgi:hypothetical protein
LARKTGRTTPAINPLYYFAYFQRDDFLAKRANTIGKMDEKYRERWNSQIGQSEESFRARAVQGLPAGTTTDLKYWGGTFNLQIFQPASDEKDWNRPLWFEYRGAPGQPMELFGAEVQTRGNRISSVVNRNMLAIADDLKVPSIGLYAKEVGAYQWARAGFVPHEDEWNGGLRQAITLRLDKLVAQSGNGLPTESEKALRQALRNSDPKAIWQVADQADMVGGQKVSQHLLVDMPWHGACNLRDPECRARFEAHTQGKPPPAWTPPHKGVGARIGEVSNAFSTLVPENSRARRLGLLGALAAGATALVAYVLPSAPSPDKKPPAAGAETLVTIPASLNVPSLAPVVSEASAKPPASPTPRAP